MTDTLNKFLATDFTKEWEKICKEHHKRTDRIQAFKDLYRARSELVLAELVSGIKRKEKTMLEKGFEDINEGRTISEKSFKDKYNL